MEINLDEAREKLVAALGDAASEYFKALKAWFRGKLSKEEFDDSARALMSDNVADMDQVLDIHNEFFLAILDRCQIRLTNRGPIYMGTGTASTVSNFEFVPEFSDKIPPLIDQRCDLVFERGHLPDRAMLSGRVHLAAWENGLRSVDADDVADVVYDAIEVLLKNVLQGAIELRRGFLVSRNGYRHTFGAKKRTQQPGDNQMRGSQAKFLVVPAKTRLAAADLIDAFSLKPNLIPSYAVRRRFLERLTNSECD